MIIDKDLNWKEHINDLIVRLKKDINLMKCLTGTDFGAKQHTLLKIYQTLIRSKIDYGCQAYNTAKKSVLEKIDIVQHQALRIATGAIRNTPVEALHVETGEMPLQLRRDEQILKYWARAQCMGEKLAISTELNKPSYSNPLDKKYRCSFTDQAKTLLMKYDLYNTQIQKETNQYDWKIKNTEIDTSLSHVLNKSDNPVVIKTLALEHIDNTYKKDLAIYTDGSKDPGNNKCGMAFVIPEKKVVMKYRISDKNSIYTAELMAINKSIEWIKNEYYAGGVRALKSREITVFSDSLSSLQALKSRNTGNRHGIIEKILNDINDLKTKNICINICWIPAHCGVAGNELADKAAKESLHNPNVQLHIPITKQDFTNIVKAKINNVWQDQWNRSMKGRWYYQINSKIQRNNTNTNKNLTRKEEIIITRLRFGKTKLNGNISIMIKDMQPKCRHCKVYDETIRHVLFECPINTIKTSEFIDRVKGIYNRSIDRLDVVDLLNPPSEFLPSVHCALIDFLKNIKYYDNI